MSLRTPPFTIMVYRFEGDRAHPHKHTELDPHTTPAQAFTRLRAVRRTLPTGYGAGLTDRAGYNVRPSDRLREAATPCAPRSTRS